MMNLDKLLKWVAYALFACLVLKYLIGIYLGVN